MAGVLAMILAGGEGTRLQPLTITRSKPSVPFGGSYRLVDFVLNNFVNSDLLRVYVLTQFKSQSLYMHMKKGWNLTGITGRFIDPIPAQMRMGKRWYDGTADAIYQNISFVELSAPDHVCIFGSDHIYKMDIRQMLEFHKQKQAVLTVAAIRVPLAEAANFGIIEVDETGRMVGFAEKPRQPKPIPGDPDHALASMGNYIFETQTLLSELNQDEAREDSSHDFGRDIIPSLYGRAPVYVYDFSTNKVEGEKGGVYWRDVGTLDAYWQAHMDLVSDEPLQPQVAAAHLLPTPAAGHLRQHRRASCQRGLLPDLRRLLPAGLPGGAQRAGFSLQPGAQQPDQPFGAVGGRQDRRRLPDQPRHHRQACGNCPRHGNR